MLQLHEKQVIMPQEAHIHDTLHSGELSLENLEVQYRIVTLSHMYACMQMNFNLVDVEADCQKTKFCGYSKYRMQQK